MPSCRVILKKLVRDNRITIDEYDKLLRNLKPQITKEDAIDYLHQIRWMQTHDKEIYKQGYECGKNERKTGKWLDRTICSNCNWYATNRYGLAVDSYFPYCPNCGAKMEVDE